MTRSIVLLVYQQILPDVKKDISLTVPTLKLYFYLKVCLA